MVPFLSQKAFTNLNLFPIIYNSFPNPYIYCKQSKKSGNINYGKLH